MNEIEEKIRLELRKTEKDKGVRVLYACESGSRSWGFPSPDSDYDVRFLYAHPEDWYLSVFTQRDVIEKPITDELDLGGWDIKKALGLLATSNAPLIEWLHSPVVYVENDDLLPKLRALAKICFRPRNACYHYYVMADKLWKKIKNSEEIKLKTLFYVLRALLCDEWIIREKSIPPVEFNLILNKYYASTPFYEAVESLIKIKSNLDEKELILRREYIDYVQCIESRINELFSMMPESFPQNTESNHKEKINALMAYIVKG